MRYRLPLVAVVLLAGCGSSPTAPPPPPPIPHATIVTAGNAQSTCIYGLCAFQAEIRNSGAGCAANVRGVTRFQTPQNTVVGTFNWSADGLVLRPGESYVYRITNIFEATLDQASAYVTVPSWDNVRC